MNRIRFFCLQILFLATPLIYAWFYVPGIPGDISDVVWYILPVMPWSWFESVKVTFFLIGIGCISLVHFASISFSRKYTSLPHHFFLVLWVFLVWSFFSFWINGDINQYFLIGNVEKHHGWFLYLGLIILFFIVQSQTPFEQKKLLKMSLLGAVWVALYAFFQKNGLDPLMNSYQTRLDTNRAFSTLGNPNYLAWLYLMVLPLIHEQIQFRYSEQNFFAKVSLWFIGALLVYWTGSYLAWMMFPLVCLFFVSRYVFSSQKSQALFWFFVFLILSVVMVCVWDVYGRDLLEMQKMKWFIARWFLWKTWIYALTSDIWHFLFWYGPDWFLVVSEHFRHPLLSVYEDPAYRIDRSHNVFIDFALHFWVLNLLFLLGLLMKQSQYLSQERKMSLFIFAFYFSFNIPVLVHFLLLVQIMASPPKS